MRGTLFLWGRNSALLFPLIVLTKVSPFSVILSNNFRQENKISVVMFLLVLAIWPTSLKTAWVGVPNIFIALLSIITRIVITVDVCIVWVNLSGIHKNKNFCTITRRFLQHAHLEGAPAGEWNCHVTIQPQQPKLKDFWRVCTSCLDKPKKARTLCFFS